MGVNLILEKRDGTGSPPEWEWLRYAGDREFAEILSKMPTRNDYDERFNEWWWQFTDHDAAIAMLPPDRPNPERLPHLINLMRARPDLWLRVSR
jgi:hypothetical protein